jgi:hypothetical protein
MRFISLDKAQDGMKLSRPATNEAGVVLLEAGTTLSSPLIKRLLRVGVRSVCIGGAPEDADIEESLAQLSKRFEMARHEPHMALLESVVAEYLEEFYAQ